jgi:radical SAM-linked protein
MVKGATLPLRLRVQFSKEDRARYLSHTEYTRTLMISARRAGLPLEYAGKGASRMKVSMSPPLPIGITSECELIDFSLVDYVPAAEAQKRLEESLPDGIRVINARLIPSDSRPTGKIIDTAVFVATFPEGTDEGDLEAAVEGFLRAESIPYERVQPRRTRVVDVRAGVHELDVLPAAEGSGTGAGLRMVVLDGIAGTTKPWEVVEILAGMARIPGGVWEQARIHRTGLFAMRAGRLVSPMDLGRRSAAAVRGAGGVEH